MFIIQIHLLQSAMEIWWHVGEDALPFQALILFYLQIVGSAVGDLKGAF